MIRKKESNKKKSSIKRVAKKVTVRRKVGKWAGKYDRDNSHNGVFLGYIDVPTGGKSEAMNQAKCRFRDFVIVHVEPNTSTFRKYAAYGRQKKYDGSD